MVIALSLDFRGLEGACGAEKCDKYNWNIMMHLYFMPLDTNINPDLCINNKIFCKLARLSLLMQKKSCFQ